jgi:hypothetical protein
MFLGPGLIFPYRARRSLVRLTLLGIVCGCLLFNFGPARAAFTVEQRVHEYGPAVEARLKPFFDEAHVDYPPARLTYVVLKAEGVLQIYAGNPVSVQDQNLPLKHIVTFRIMAESGTLGPKLRWLDNQVPEGIYEADYLNPNSDFHLALHVNYPNKDDIAHAHDDHRSHLGGEIMIHGSRYSIGCVAMGDEVAEDLFVLAALIPWLHGLYERIGKALESCPLEN